jgi:hypothetical protein
MLALGVLLGMVYLWRDARARGAAALALAGEAVGPPRPQPPAHVHTYRRSSSEATAGEAVDVWRCGDCGDVVRWVRAGV